MVARSVAVRFALPVVLFAACQTAAPAPTVTSPIPGLDLARLQPRRDAFTVLVQGKPLGTQTCSIERSADGWLYVETTAIPPMVQQTTEVWLAADGRMQRVRQRGTMGGKPMQIDAAYEGGSVLADAVTPSAAAPVHSELHLGPAAVDDNALQALLPALVLNGNVPRTWTVFSTGKGKTETARVERVGVETVTTKAGPVAASRIRVKFADTAMEFVIGDAAPHWIWSSGAPGTQFVMQRVE